jgi:hypothetical protein
MGRVRLRKPRFWLLYNNAIAGKQTNRRVFLIVEKRRR